MICPEDLDRRLGWQPGTAARLARRRRLPHNVLPDGSVRFDWAEVERLIVKVPAAPSPPTEGDRRA